MLGPTSEHPRNPTPTSKAGQRGTRTGTASASKKAAAVVAALLALVAIAYTLVLPVAYADRVYPGVRAAGIELAGLNRQEAVSALSGAFARFAEGEVVLRYGAQEWRQSLGALGARLDAEATARAALLVGHSGSLPERLMEQVEALRNGRTLGPVLASEAGQRRAAVSRIAHDVDRPMVNASLVTSAKGTVELLASQVGRRLDVDEAVRRIDQSATDLLSGWTGGRAGFVVELPVVETKPRVVEAQLAAAKDTAQAILSEPLTISYGSQAVELSPAELVDLLAFREEGGKTVAELDDEALAGIVEGLAESIDRSPRDARFTFRSGKVQRVSESADGLQVDVPASVRDVQAGARGVKRTVGLVVQVVPPKLRSTDISAVVIREKLVEAVTVYGDTGADRQHNLRLAASRLNGVLLAPGETFSFNKALGPTTLKDGYRMAWGIISTPTGHETIPSEAGGICQVSTTLFQAALAAGVKIDQRTEHLYWMPRYGKPPLGKTGLDSTVDGSGSPDTLDFKFTNTTPNWLAIEARTDAMNLYFALWGTTTGWRVEVGEPVITNVVKTDPTVRRQYDESLRPGEEVWAEVAQDGFDVSVNRKVWDGDRLLDQYVAKSRYRPANNVVRYGPTPVATATPTTRPDASARPSATPGLAATHGGPTATPAPSGSRGAPAASPTGTPAR